MSTAVAPQRKTLKVVCPHDCPDTCVMTVDVEDGRAVGLGGDPEHRFTAGFLCAKVNHYLERVYSPDRVLHPLRRVGKKGEGKFERVSCDEALDEIAARLKAIDDPESILPCSYAGTMGMVQYSSMDRRFLHRLGASLLDRTLCSSAGKYGMKASLGGSVAMKSGNSLMSAPAEKARPPAPATTSARKADSVASPARQALRSRSAARLTRFIGGLSIVATATPSAGQVTVTSGTDEVDILIPSRGHRRDNAAWLARRLRPAPK